MFIFKSFLEGILLMNASLKSQAQALRIFFKDVLIFIKILKYNVIMAKYSEEQWQKRRKS